MAEVIALKEERAVDLARAGVVLEARPGLWYLSESAYVAYREGQSRRGARVALVAILAAVLLMVGIIFAVAPGSQR